MKFRQIVKLIPFRFRKMFPESIYKHLYFEGLFPLYFDGKPIGQLNSIGTKIENDIFWKGLDGGHEPLSMKLWIYLIQEIKPKVVLDIGANTGLYGIIAKIVDQSTQVFFFEPAFEATEVIKKSLAANHRSSDYKIYNVALSNRTYLAKNAVSTGSKLMPYIFLQRDENHVDPVPRSIHVSRLDDLIRTESLSFENIDLVKIDIEGHEKSALEGFGDFLNKSIIFLIEILNVHSKNMIKAFFPSHEYYFINIDDDKLTLRLDNCLQPSMKWNVLIIPRHLNDAYSILPKILGHSS